MKDINLKKSSKTTLPSEKKISRADEIEEIYRGANHSHRDTNPEEDWSRAVSRRQPKWRKWLGTALVSVVVVALLMVVWGMFFGKATVIIAPKQGGLFLSGVEDATKRDTTSSSTAATLSYDTVSKVEDSEKVLVNASGQEKVEKRAEGQVVAYNQNTTKQKLVANTRFQAPDSKIYRLKEAISIPAAVKKGTEVTPGSVLAVVIADKAGAEYNRSATDFTIPGFAGTAKFKTIFGRSKADIKGGFVGTVRKVSQADLDKNRAELQKILRDRLIVKAKQDVPDEYILFTDAVKINYEDQVINDTTLSADKAYVAVKATLSGIIFKRTELAGFYAQKLIPNYDNTPVEITNLESLEFALQNKDILDLEKTAKISFSLDGTGNVVWTFDQNKVKDRLIGLGKKEAEKVWPDFGSIGQVRVVFFPPWLWTFPTDKDKIIIEIDKVAKKS
ncbi:MAG: hypothetical protein WCW56_01660 [Candidatus Paceibacterota bacterium]|jgi:hypothetical protein